MPPSHPVSLKNVKVHASQSWDKIRCPTPLPRYESSSRSRVSPEEPPQSFFATDLSESIACAVGFPTTSLSQSPFAAQFPEFNAAAQCWCQKQKSTRRVSIGTIVSPEAGWVGLGLLFQSLVHPDRAPVEVGELVILAAVTSDHLLEVREVMVVAVHV